MIYRVTAVERYRFFFVPSITTVFEQKASANTTIGRWQTATVTQDRRRIINENESVTRRAERFVIAETRSERSEAIGQRATG